MHFLGGFVVALFFIWFFFYSNYIEKQNWHWYVLLIIISGSTLLIGVGWEFFEFLIDTLLSKKIGANLAQLTLADTMLDLLMDIFGSLFASIMFLFRNR